MDIHNPSAADQRTALAIATSGIVIVTVWGVLIAASYLIAALAVVGGLLALPFGYVAAGLTVAGLGLAWAVLTTIVDFIGYAIFRFIVGVLLALITDRN